jgi:hypothetical protein
VTVAVVFWRKKLDFEVPRKRAIDYLFDTGGWSFEDLDELTDDEIAEKILWIACCDINERQENPEDWNGDNPEGTWWFGMVY